MSQVATPRSTARSTVVPLPEEGDVFDEIHRQFPDRLDGLACYAKLMGRRFSRSMTIACVCCGSTDRTHQENYTWEAYVDTRATALRSILTSAVTMMGGILVSSWHHLTFTTQHTFCAGCSRTALFKQGLASVIHYLCFAFSFVTLIALAVSVVFLGAGILHDRGLIWGSALAALISLIPLAACIGGFRFGRRLAVPEPLRGIGRFPFAFKSSKWAR